jgi:hypothetical protein
MRVVNDGEVPVRIVADARLLSLRVTPRGAFKGEWCELPADMRPEDDLGRNLVLPPKRSYVEIFEPSYYCFSSRALAALNPTSIVEAHLGWTKKIPRGPQVLTPIDGVTPEVSARRSLDAPPIALPDEKFRSEDAEPKGAGEPLNLKAPTSIDADSPDEVPLPVSLRNSSSRPEWVRFRPDSVGFDVTSASGTERCAWPTRPAAPIRELFTRLAPRGTAELTFSLAAYCLGRSLDQPGLLVVRPWLDTSSSPEQVIGLSAFSGRIVAKAPTLIRLHRGKNAPVRAEPELAPP